MSKILKVVGASWLQTKISSYILGFLGILSILALFIGQLDRIQEDGNFAATIYFSKIGYRIEYWGQSNKLAEIPLGVARAYVRRDLDTDGWYLLEVETNGEYPDETQAYAAGVVEGALTWSLIHTQLENTVRRQCQDKEEQCLALQEYFEKSVNKWKEFSEKNSNDPFWHQVSLYYTQINGIYTGWKYGIERNEMEYDSDIYQLYWLNAMSEIPEIQRKLNLTVEDSASDYVPGLSSAFLRIVNETSTDGDDRKRLMVAQNAAGSYHAMTRILKRYKLNYHLKKDDPEFAPGTQVDFSGYPGSVTSQDEFYLLRGKDHRLAVTGTTLRNYNDDLWKEVDIVEQLPVGPRVFAANRLATNATSWVHTLASDNSGTGCKQWLVADFNVFDQLHGQASLPRVVTQKDAVTEITYKNGQKHTRHGSTAAHDRGLLWLVEQVPHLIHAQDLTGAFLNQSYWATYGIPYNFNISKITKVTDMHEKYGDIFSLSTSPRALAFKQGFTKAVSVKHVIDLMRDTNLTAIGNKSENCQESKVDCVMKEEGYWSVVGVRGDIVKNHREPFGVIDTKIITGTTDSSAMEFIAIAGPPYTEEIKRPNVTDVNRGNVATVYTDKFNHKSTINGLEIHNYVQEQKKHHEQNVFENLNKDNVKPFVWSRSDFDEGHEGMPDKWAFGTYKPNWSW